MGSYFEHLTARNYRPTYVAAQLGTLRRLARFLSGDLLGVTIGQLDAYLDSRHFQPSSRAVEIAHLRGFYAWALDQELVTADPTRRLVKPRAVRRLPRPMPDPDIALAFRTAPVRVAPILYLAFYAGLRCCEIAQLRAEDIGPDVIVVNESKGGHMTTVPLSPQLARALKDCELPARGWLFPRHDSGHLTRSRVGQLANRHLASLGITHTLHTLRHAYGTHLQRATGNLRVTQELMRHRSPASTAIYTFVSNEERTAALERLPMLA